MIAPPITEVQPIDYEVRLLDQLLATYTMSLVPCTHGANWDSGNTPTIIVKPTATALDDYHTYSFLVRYSIVDRHTRSLGMAMADSLASGRLLESRRCIYFQHFTRLSKSVSFLGHQFKTGTRTLDISYY